MDWNVYYSNISRYSILNNWQFDEKSETYDELNELFHNNNNKDTNAEFVEDDDKGLSFVISIHLRRK